MKLERWRWAPVITDSRGRECGRASRRSTIWPNGTRLPVEFRGRELGGGEWGTRAVLEDDIILWLDLTHNSVLSLFLTSSSSTSISSLLLFFFFLKFLGFSKTAFFAHLLLLNGNNRFLNKLERKKNWIKWKIKRKIIYLEIGIILNAFEKFKLTN